MPKTITPQQAAQLERLYPFYQRNEKSTREIAEEVGIDISTARRYIVMLIRGCSLEDYINAEPNNGYGSPSEQQKANISHRQQNPKNRCLRDLVIEGLEKLDITGAELARRLGVSKQLMSRYTQGKSMPPQDVFERMCQEFGTPHGELAKPLRRYYRRF